MSTHHESKISIAKRFVPLLAVIVFIVGVTLSLAQAQSSFKSVEVAFTDTSAHGMQIVPASCPSDPFDADSPYGCSGSTALCPNGITPAPGGDVSACTCSEGNGSACASTLCPDGSAAPGGNSVNCSCAQGNTSACTSPTTPGGSNGGTGGGGLTQNGNPVSSCSTGYTQEGSICVFTGCPTGYSRSTDSNGNPECIFEGCPTGYVQQGNMCVQDQCVNGYICGADGNLYLESSSCSITLAQTCSFGCAASACFFPTASADIIAIPGIVKSGETSNISWRADNVQSCTISGTNGDSWSCSGNSCAATTTQTSGAIKSQTTFTMSCTGLDSSHISAAASVNVVPNFVEQ